MKKKIVVFGVGGCIYSSIIDTLLSNYEIVMLTDNNHELWGKQKNGLEIKPPDLIGNCEYDMIIIASSFIVDIAKQLTSYGLPLNKIDFAYNFIFKYKLKNATVQTTLDDNFNVLIQNSMTHNGLYLFNYYQDKHVLFKEHNIKTIIETLLENDVDHFFKISKYFNKSKEGTFVDVGANIGTSTLEASENINVTKCIAFEPSSDNYSLLMSNIYANKLQDKVSAYNYAVDEQKGKVKLLLSEECSGDNKITTDNNSTSTNVEMVNSIALDEFLSGHYEEIKYLWFDVQGYEYFALKGCEEILKNHDPAIQIEYWPHGLSGTNSLDLLNEFLIKNFNYYVDMDEYDGKNPIIKDIIEIKNLPQQLHRKKSKAHTNLFLLKSLMSD